MRQNIYRILAICCLALTAQLAKSADTPPRKAGEVVIESLSLTTPDTGKVAYELGTLYVPENRVDPKSRLIGVGFARFKAAKATAPPTFHLPGGPGSSLLPSFKQDNPLLGRALKYVNLYGRAGDVVFVDQRGFSERGDVLRFRHRTKAEPLEQPGSLTRATESYTEMARAAVADYAKKSIDLRGYTVKECADDVNDLRKSLGYEQITLVGTSFGSQWSFAIMRLHPKIVARALLSGIEPLDMGYDMPSHIFAAIQRSWWEAEKDPKLKPYIPPGGLRQAAREVMQRLERSPVQVTVNAKDPKTGEKLKVTLGREDCQRDGFFRGPAFLLSVYHEHYDEWAATVMNNRRAHDMDVRLIGPLIDTSLGVTPKRKFMLRNDPATEFLGQWNFDAYLATTGIWLSPDVGDEFRTEIVSRIPVVFTQGDWDVQTPVENVLNIAPFFPNSRVLIAEHGGHGVLGPIAQNLPDVMAKLQEFIETGNMTNIPPRVKLPIPKFAAPDFPPPEKK